MSTESSRVRSMNETRDRILDVALDVLGENPDAGMGDIASAAGVVRRTVYGHFPSRLDLVRTLTERAVTEMTAVLTEVNASGAEADATWVKNHRHRIDGDLAIEVRGVSGAVTPAQAASRWPARAGSRPRRSARLEDPTAQGSRTGSSGSR